MKKVAIVGLGWLGMPLALSLMARGWQVTGSKTTQDGVEAARMCGIDSYPLRLEPQLVCDTEDLDALMNVDALVITLPARRTGAGRVLSAGGAGDRRYRAGAPYSADRLHQLHLGVWQRQRHGERELPASAANRQRAGAQGAGGLAAQPAGHLGGYSAPGRAGGAFPSSGTFFAGKSAPDGQHVVNLVHLQDVVAAIELLLQAPKGGHIYNICAPRHPARGLFYPQMARELGLPPPVFSDSPDGGQGKIVDGNRICNELGFEYQYPDPLVMPME
jgi:nucleoside-diphosphate-sugar epimerase